MSVVIRTPRTSRLSKMINASGGSSVGVALARARTNLAALEPRGLEMAGQFVAQLVALPPPETPDHVQSRLEAAYRAAAGVLDVAGPFERHDLCTAALSLCDLIDGSTEARFDWRVLQVHARAMELMLSLPASAEDQRRRILEGLAEVRSRKLA